MDNDALVSRHFAVWPNSHRVKSTPEFMGYLWKRLSFPAHSPGDTAELTKPISVAGQGPPQGPPLRRLPHFAIIILTAFVPDTR